MVTLDEISRAVITLIRLGAAFRLVYCMVRLEGSEEERGAVQKEGKEHRAVLYPGGVCVAD